MSKKDKLDKYSFFEVMDRTSEILRNFSESVGDHPVVKQNEELKESCNKVIATLFNTYQLSAKIFFDKDHEKPSLFPEEGTQEKEKPSVRGNVGRRLRKRSVS